MNNSSSTYIYDGKEVPVPSTAELIASLHVESNKPGYYARPVRVEANDYPTVGAVERKLTDGESWTVWGIAELYPVSASKIALAWSRGWAAHLDTHLTVSDKLREAFTWENEKHVNKTTEGAIC